MNEPKRKLWLIPANIIGLRSDKAFRLGKARGYKRAIKKLESMRSYIEPHETQTLNDLLRVLKHDLTHMPYSEPEHDGMG